MNIFKFRAECERDVTEVRKIFGKEIKRINMTIWHPYPDIEVEIQTELSLEEIKESIEDIRDGHVMLETITLKEDYTGIRN